MNKKLMKGYDLYLTGTIIKGIGGFYYVKAEDSTVYECKARGVFRKNNIKPMIGDRVNILIEKEGYASINEIEKRTSCLIRPPVANIDTLIICMATKNPCPDYLLCDKLLIMAFSNNIEPVICITKTDIATPDDIVNTYKNTGVKIFEISKDNPDSASELKKFLINKTSAFSGLSGVGKSTFLNGITEKDIETGEISKIKRGKNTTRHVELFELPDGGYVLDTPGFSSFETENISCEDLYKYYPEMKSIGDKCRFTGCSHITEPDCLVKEALKSGKISQIRYENYKIIYNTLKNTKKW